MLIEIVHTFYFRYLENWAVELGTL